ncbi:hypothetical protein [Nostoc commune]|uniref:hypothetical protein n=1 Tax=Nostoc commune TaxID=1178 RepID=UPI0018C4FA41|nr:hypothetical protein [Nostoc commune]MBG1260439.1 hypothetical protein [Nostoc commune BAE]
MIDDNKLKIQLEDVINNIREEVTTHHFKHFASKIAYDAEISRIINIISNIENIIKYIEYKTYIKLNLSSKLNWVPFNLEHRIEKFILKVINYLFKEQREININLILILKESVELNRQLVQQLAILKTQINQNDHNKNNYIE